MDISHKVQDNHTTSTDPKNLGNKESPREDVRITLRRGNKIVIRGRWKEGTGWIRVEVRRGNDGGLWVLGEGREGWENRN